MARLPKRDNCRYCGKTWDELGIRTRVNRQMCYSAECRAKYQQEQRDKAKEDHSADEWHAGRTQGEFFVPAVERGQSKRLDESFFCWICHKEHKPKAVTSTLGLTCECGAVFIFSLGLRNEYVYIVRVDRMR